LVAQAGSSPERGEIEKDVLDGMIGVARIPQYLVMLHKDQEPIFSGTKQWLDKRLIENHFHVRWNNNDDFHRLARFLTGNAIGLVLSGGGARGLSYIGVIRALLEEGIPIDMIGGTSIGAMASAGYAIGLNYQEMIQLSKKMLKLKPHREFTLPIISLFKSKRINRDFRLVFGDKLIEDLWINSFCVSCDLSRAETAVLKNGPLWKAVRASMSLPGIFEPVVYENNLLVDGGVLNNMPCDIMKSLCRGYVIAVSASLETKNKLNLDCEEMPSPWDILLSKILPYRKPISFPSIFDVILCCSMLGSRSQLKNTMSYADFHLNPPTDGYRLLDFSQIDDIAEIGYRHTKAKMDELKQSLRLAL
jgi:NTE family protein/lysophospholipid hydrolase